MALQTFQARVEDSYGETVSGADVIVDDVQLKDLLNQGWYDIVSRLPLRLLDRMGVEATIDDSPTSHTMDTGKILSVVRSDGAHERSCQEVSAQLRGDLLNPYSMQYATADWPKYYKSGNVLYIVPTTTASEVAKVVEVGLSAEIAASATSATGFDPGLSSLLILYVVIGLILREVGVMRRNSQDELEAITTSGYLVNFESALPTFVDPANPSMQTLVLTDKIVLPVLTLSGATDTWPTFAATLSLPSLILSTMIALPSFGSVSITSPGTLSMPSVPSLPSLVLALMESLPSDLAEANIDFSGIATPSYVAPTIGTSIGSLSIANKTITDPGTLSLPSAIVLPLLTLTTAPTFSGLTLSSIPTASLSYTSAGAAPSSTVSISTSIPTFLAPSAFTYSTSIITDALDKARDLIDDATGMSTGDSIETLLASDKWDKTRVQTAVATQEVNRASTAIQDELAQLKEYEAELQEAVGRFATEVQARNSEVGEQVSEVQAGIAAYSAKAQDELNKLSEGIAQFREDISAYQKESTAVIQEWTAEEVQFKLGKWATQVQSEIGEYQQKSVAFIGDYRESSSAAISEYRANVERQIQEFKSEMDADVAEWNTQKQADLTKYQNDIQESIGSYQAEIQHYTVDINKLAGQYIAESRSDVDIYRSNVEKFIQKFTQQNDANVKEYQSVASATIAKYQAEIQDNVSEFSVNVDYRIKEAQANLAIESQQYREKSNSYIGEYQAKTTAEIQKYTVDIDKNIREYTSKAGSYAIQVDAYIKELTILRNSDISEYREVASAVVSRYTSENQALIAEFTTNFQQEVSEYSSLVQGEAARVQSDLSKARSYLEESAIRLQTMQSFDQKSVASLQEMAILKKSYIEDIDAYIKGAL